MKPLRLMTGNDSEPLVLKLSRVRMRAQSLVGDCTKEDQQGIQSAVCALMRGSKEGSK